MPSWPGEVSRTIDEDGAQRRQHLQWRNDIMLSAPTLVTDERKASTSTA